MASPWAELLSTSHSGGTLDQVPFPKADTVLRSAKAEETLLGIRPSCPFMQLRVTEKGLLGLSCKVGTFLGPNRTKKH